jgi:Tol biopolymer transport system component
MTYRTARLHCTAALINLTALPLTGCGNAAGDLTGNPNETKARSAQFTRNGDGSRIAFSSDRDGPGSAEIYTMNPDGTDQRQLTSTPGNSNGPALSPNGRRIAFHSNRGGGTDIYIMNVDGTGVTRLTNLTALGPSAHFANWSPNGQWVVMNSFVQPRDIYIVKDDGGALTNLTNHPSDDLRPDWSPDGRTIAFTSNRAGNPEIYLMQTDGTDPVRLTFAPGADGNAEWSPNGRKIAFESNRDGNAEIYVMNDDGSDPVRLTFNPASDTKPTWSPDGRSIAFHRQVQGNLQVFSMNADGTGVSQLTQSSPGFSGFPSWGQGHAQGQ